MAAAEREISTKDIKFKETYGMYKEALRIYEKSEKTELGEGEWKRFDNLLNTFDTRCRKDPELVRWLENQKKPGESGLILTLDENYKGLANELMKYLARKQIMDKVITERLRDNAATLQIAKRFAGAEQISERPNGREIPVYAVSTLLKGETINENENPQSRVSNKALIDFYMRGNSVLSQIEGEVERRRGKGKQLDDYKRILNENIEHCELQRNRMELSLLMLKDEKISGMIGSIGGEIVGTYPKGDLYEQRLRTAAKKVRDAIGSIEKELQPYENALKDRQEVYKEAERSGIIQNKDANEARDEEALFNAGIKPAGDQRIKLEMALRLMKDLNKDIVNV